MLELFISYASQAICVSFFPLQSETNNMSTVRGLLGTLAPEGGAEFCGRRAGFSLHRQPGLRLSGLFQGADFSNVMLDGCLLRF